MEILELKYFSVAAKFENIGKAAKKLAISPSAITKAIQRLEAELGVALFLRQGRGLRLTDAGKKLQRQSALFIDLERETKIALAAATAEPVIRVAGPEILLSSFGIALIAKIQKVIPQARFSIHQGDEETAQALVRDGASDLCLITGSVPRLPELTYKVLNTVRFATYVSKQHHAYSKLVRGPSDISKILEYDFVVPLETLFGTIDASSSADGWRDDKLKRRIAFEGVGLKTLENLVSAGKAIAYLPDHYAATLPLMKVEITGCPYECEQEILFAAKHPREKQWLRSVF